MDKTGRNDPCPCGSGKKYKKCCQGKDAVKARSGGPERAPVSNPPPTYSGVDIPDGMTPYVIARLFEDSDSFAEMQRLDPQKARHFWTPRKVAALSTADILAQLRQLAVDASPEAYLALAESETSGWAVSERWRAAIAGQRSRYADDFLGLAACELWKRYCPERPSIEMLDDQMQEGYRLAAERQGAKACDVWWEVWRTIRSRLQPEMRTLQQAGVVFAGMQCLHNWLQDFAIELHNAALVERRYMEIGVQLCEDVLAQFPDESELLLMNFRIGLGELHFLAGDLVKGEEAMLAVIRDYPDCACGYARWANLLAYGVPPSHKPIDRNRARDLLKQALARPVTDAADYSLEERLAQLQEGD